MVKPVKQPNIVFILIDDMGWRDIGCYGSPFYETPHLDHFAARGMRFSDAYATCPVCSPTRASIMSGKYPATVGVTNFIGPRENKPNNELVDLSGKRLTEAPFTGDARGKRLDAPYTRYLPLTEASLASALREGGYRTWHVGKWHLGGEEFYPEHHGFDVNIGGCNWGMPRKGYYSPYGIVTLAEGPVGEYLTDRITDEAIRLIREGKDEKRPFFLNLWHYAVHTPIQPPPGTLVEKYRAKAEALGLHDSEALEEGERFPCEHKKHQRVTRRLFQSNPQYAAMVEHLDASIGRLLEALEESGKLDNTWIFFTSDNGGLSTAEGSPTSNAPLHEGKGWMYDGGVREPLIAAGPGLALPGSVCDVPVTATDFYPTFLELAGLPLRPEQHVDGVSLAGLLRGRENKLEREAIYWHYPHYGNQGGTPGSSVRMGDYKLIEFFEDGRLELYNLREDEGERHNLAGDRPELARSLHQRLVEWRESIEAKIPEANPDYVPW
jgi:arylsulfatase A-like enzyme